MFIAIVSGWTRRSRKPSRRSNAIVHDCAYNNFLLDVADNDVDNVDGVEGDVAVNVDGDNDDDDDDDNDDKDDGDDNDDDDDDDDDDGDDVDAVINVDQVVVAINKALRVCESGRNDDLGMRFCTTSVAN